MNNLINFPSVNENNFNNVNTAEDYRLVLKKKLDIYDYEEFLMALVDDYYYDTADEEIQGMVDTYYELWE